MRDFATPTGDSSPAHAHLDAIVRDPMEDLPARLLAVGWISRCGQWRFVVTSTGPILIAIESDPWWGRISRRAVGGRPRRGGSVIRRSDFGADVGEW